MSFPVRDLGVRLRLETLIPQSWAPGHLCHASLGPRGWYDLSLFFLVHMKQGAVRIRDHTEEDLGLAVGWHGLRDPSMARWHR